MPLQWNQRTKKCKEETAKKTNSESENQAKKTKTERVDCNGKDSEIEMEYHVILRCAVRKRKQGLIPFSQYLINKKRIARQEAKTFPPMRFFY
ncbi:MAG: hypothetical protein IKD31_05230 [Clostridia bacterium]|nr:hypothetical protein [Clostridia bacterium]